MGLRRVPEEKKVQLCNGLSEDSKEREYEVGREKNFGG